VLHFSEYWILMDRNLWICEFWNSYSWIGISVRSPTRFNQVQSARAHLSLPSFSNYQLLQQKLPEEEGDCAPASTLSQDLTIPKVRDLHHMVDIIMQINALWIYYNESQYISILWMWLSWAFRIASLLTLVGNIDAWILLLSSCPVGTVVDWVLHCPA
jgi:hypothetical protein